jgi:hypothetical protein
VSLGKNGNKEDRDTVFSALNTHARIKFLISRKAGCDGLLQASSCFCALTDGASGFTLLEVILDDFYLLRRTSTQRDENLVLPFSHMPGSRLG